LTAAIFQMLETSNCRSGPRNNVLSGFWRNNQDFLKGKSGLRQSLSAAFQASSPHAVVFPTTGHFSVAKGASQCVDSLHTAQTCFSVSRLSRPCRSPAATLTRAARSLVAIDRPWLDCRHFRKLQAWPKDFQANPMHIRCKGRVPYCSKSTLKPNDRIL
jgi:hypothetical protein